MALHQTKQQSNNDTSGNDLAVDSSFIQRVTYDKAANSLTVYLKSGHDITYQQVYEDTWTAFQLAPSKGSFYTKQIRGKYQSISEKKVPSVEDFKRNQEKIWKKLLK